MIVYTYLPSATKLRMLCFYTSLSVILFMGGGSASVHAGIPPRDQAHPHWSRQQPPRPGTPGTRHPPLGADTPQDQAPPPPADGYCCGRYTSYWNVFLFSMVFGREWVARYITCMFMNNVFQSVSVVTAVQV